MRKTSIFAVFCSLSYPGDWLDFAQAQTGKYGYRNRKG